MCIATEYDGITLGYQWMYMFRKAKVVFVNTLWEYQSRLLRD